MESSSGNTPGLLSVNFVSWIWSGNSPGVWLSNPEICWHEKSSALWVIQVNFHYCVPFVISTSLRNPSLLPELCAVQDGCLYRPLSKGNLGFSDSQNLLFYSFLTGCCPCSHVPPAGRAGEWLPRELLIIVINALSVTKFHQSSPIHQSQTILLCTPFLPFCLHTHKYGRYLCDGWTRWKLCEFGMKMCFWEVRGPIDAWLSP